MPVGNPLLTEILNVINPEKSELVTVDWRKTKWSFATLLSERDHLWIDSKVPTTSGGTMMAYSVYRIPEIAAALREINGKPVRVYLSDVVAERVKPLRDSGAVDSEQLDWYSQTVCRDALHEWLLENFDRTSIAELYDLYVEKAREPAEKKRKDFFGSSTATPPTPAGQTGTSSS